MAATPPPPAPFHRPSGNPWGGWSEGVLGFPRRCGFRPMPPPPPAARSLWAFEQTPPPPRLCGGSLEDVPRSRPRRPEEVWAGGSDALWPALALPWAPCTRRGGDVTIIWWFLCGSGVFCSSSRCSHALGPYFCLSGPRSCSGQSDSGYSGVARGHLQSSETFPLFPPGQRVTKLTSRSLSYALKRVCHTCPSRLVTARYSQASPPEPRISRPACSAAQAQTLGGGGVSL